MFDPRLTWLPCTVKADTGICKRIPAIGVKSLPFIRARHESQRGKCFCIIFRFDWLRHSKVGATTQEVERLNIAINAGRRSLCAEVLVITSCLPPIAEVAPIHIVVFAKLLSPFGPRSHAFLAVLGVASNVLRN